MFAAAKTAKTFLPPPGEPYDGPFVPTAPQISLSTGAMTVGKAFSARVTVKAADPAVTGYAISAGVLPAGLRLDTVTGVISGRPTKAGRFGFTIRATNGLTGTLSRTVTVAKAASAVALSVKPKRIVAKKTKAKVTIRVATPDVSGVPLTGRVTVKVGKKKARTVTFTAAHRGQITVNLPKLAKKGKHRVKVTYAGHADLVGQSRTITVRAR